MDVREFVKPKVNPSIPQISPGDTVKVSLRTMEGDKERLQNFQGVVIKMRKGAAGGSFTVRRVSYGIGVERTFPFQSPLVQNVAVLRHGQVHRAKLYYMRRLSVKQARLKERRERVLEPCLKRKNLHKQNKPLNELRRGGSQLTGEPVSLFLRHTTRPQYQCRPSSVRALRLPNRSGNCSPIIGEASG
jgi:large subunit ribosomal protein L19